MQFGVRPFQGACHAPYSHPSTAVYYSSSVFSPQLTHGGTDVKCKICSNAGAPIYSSMYLPWKGTLVFPSTQRPSTQRKPYPVEPSVLPSIEYPTTVVGIPGITYHSGDILHEKTRESKTIPAREPAPAWYFDPAMGPSHWASCSNPQDAEISAGATSHPGLRYPTIKTKIIKQNSYWCIL